MNRAVIAILVIIVGANVYGFVHRAQVAQNNKNLFVNGCTQSGELHKPVCSCAYDKLVQMYPDFATNVERLNRIITDGYNTDETSVVVQCV